MTSQPKIEYIPFKDLFRNMDWSEYKLLSEKSREEVERAVNNWLYSQEE